ncbi:NUDIX hydrolase [Corynebacterium epidermidicanis]|uniref:NUDIX family protein n=1 Tax=Corynebacterium epidermidicanis TaxID=1050174 RepID=A0A0G3GQR2_9CORY|nr:NUDIX hydrolase [Corynebacterium epidermidicanis]AKK02905.1 NUDIX family protein [Corynebacterium epidermidicanis]
MITGVNGARLAATVLLVRDTPLGLEVYVQERVSEMPTFPNTTVFPGGGVDERDLGDSAGIDTARWSKQLGMPPEIAHGIVMAAVREVFEETGVLLARDREGLMVECTRAFDQERQALESKALSFSEFLKRHEFTLAPELLRPFARWVGPEGAEVQFDAFSFVAQLPPGQSCQGDTREASSTGWFAPSVLLGGWRTGLLRLVVPTWAQLKVLSMYSSVAELNNLLQDPDMTPIIGDPRDNPWFNEYFSHIDHPERF